MVVKRKKLKNIAVTEMCLSNFILYWNMYFVPTAVTETVFNLSII